MFRTLQGDLFDLPELSGEWPDIVCLLFDLLLKARCAGRISEAKHAKLVLWLSATDIAFDGDERFMRLDETGCRILAQLLAEYMEHHGTGWVMPGTFCGFSPPSCSDTDLQQVYMFLSENSSVEID